MATTTTFAAIREQYLTKIRAITPSVLAGHVFSTPNTRIPLKAWAMKSAGSQCFRAFGITFDDVVEEPQDFESTAYQRMDTATLVIAYPVDLALYYKDDDDQDLANFDDVINSDSDQVRDVLTSTGNLIAGHSEMRVVRRATMRETDAIWFH